MATSRERTPRGQGDLLRERLIDAALALIDAEGETAAITIRAVARGAGVSPNAFYLHFDSRETLIAACLERCFADFRDSVREGAADGSSARDALRRAGAAYVRFASAWPGRYSVMFGQELEGKDREHKPASAHEAYDDLVALVAASAEPAPSEERAVGLAQGVFSGLHGYVSLRATRPMLDWPEPDDFLDRLADAWLGPAGSG